MPSLMLERHPLDQALESDLNASRSRDYRGPRANPIKSFVLLEESHSARALAVIREPAKCARRSSAAWNASFASKISQTPPDRTLSHVPR
jgi:hypothetical protein